MRIAKNLLHQPLHWGLGVREWGMSKKVQLTASRIESLTWSEEKEQVFLWDSKTKGLGVRLKRRGVPTFVFQGLFQKKTLRVTIGEYGSTWKLPKAHERARELQRLIDEGRDPREVKAEALAKDEASREIQRQEHVTVGAAWSDYMLRGKPKKKHGWSTRYKSDLVKMADPGGQIKKRGKGLTLPGPIASLLPRPMKEMTPINLRAWHEKEAVRGGPQATRAVQMFSGFLRWCSTQEAYDGIADAGAARDPKVQDALPRAGRHRTDFLEEGQLAAWFSGVEQLSNRTMASYLVGLLITGARRNELSGLKWSDVDFRWRKVTLHDKSDDSVDRVRTIPLLPYFEHIARALPKIDGNDFVFASSRAKGKPIQDARSAMAEVLRHAGIKHLTFHGLRRSFTLLGEAAGCPSGAISQVMGHQPGSMSERYKTRTIDQLRPFLAKAERFIIETGAVVFDFDAEPAKSSKVTPISRRA